MEGEAVILHRALEQVCVRETGETLSRQLEAEAGSQGGWVWPGDAELAPEHLH